MPKTKPATLSAFDRWYRNGHRKVARKTVDVVKPEDAEKVRGLLAQRVRLLERERNMGNTQERLVLRNKIADIERELAKLGETWDTVKDGPFTEFLTAHGLNLPGLGGDDEAVEIPPMVGKQEGFGKDAGYTVIESFVLRNKHDGKTISPYGALPYGNASDWERVAKGWTVRNENNGTVGIGRAPWATKAEAEAFAKAHNAPRASMGDTARTFDKAYWTKDSVRENSWTGMRGNWFLSAKLKRTKDGARWVSQAKHKDTGERRIGGMFVSVVDAQNAVARLAVDAPPKKREYHIVPSGGWFDISYMDGRGTIHIIDSYKTKAEAEAAVRSLLSKGTVDAGDPKKITQIKADMTKVRQKIAALRGSDPEQIKDLQFILQNLQGDLDEEMTGDREI